MSTSLTTAVCKSGETIELDTRQETGFGFNPGNIVHFTKSLRNGKVALIRGTYDGMLWFSVFPTVAEAAAEEALSAPVDTFSARGREEIIRQYGWVIDDVANTFI